MSDLAISARRDPEKVVVLFAGHSGHGKSLTINRLVGHKLLFVVWSTTFGLTTKAMQRVIVPIKNKEKGVDVTFAFDDTPGLEDTACGDEQTNAILMRQYAKTYFPNTDSSPLNPTFPHVILIVASWDSIARDAHNEPNRFTSAVGRSIMKLKNFGLVDLEYPNIIVVVTKSRSYLRELEGYETEEKKNAQWKIAAGERKGAILELQRRAFPKSTPWPVVFIENESARKMDAPFPRLPNGELSHQNLFNTILDFLPNVGGIQALRKLAKEDFGFLDWAGEPKTLLSPEDIITEPSSILPPSVAASTPNRIRDLADEYLGVVYNPVRGAFGFTRVLEFDPSRLRVENNQENDSRLISQDSDRTASLAGITDSSIGLSSHYATSLAFDSAKQAAKSKKSDVHLIRHVTAVATILGNPTLSNDTLKEINRLPSLPEDLAESSQFMQKYYDFFESYGTHIVLSVALGGLLRVVSPGDMEDQQTDGRSIHDDVMSFQDGGGAVAGRLGQRLERNFTTLRNHSSVKPSDWNEIYEEWIQAVDINDPVFCADDKETKYCRWYELDGPTEKQKVDLKRASESYLRTLPKRKHTNVLQQKGQVTGEMKGIERHGFFATFFRMLFAIFKGRNPSTPSPPSKFIANEDIASSNDLRKNLKDRKKPSKTKCFG